MDDINLIMQKSATSPVSEIFRGIRTNIQFSGCNEGEKRQCIAFTSSVSGEGTSTVIANVALAFAREGKKTLLLDADLREPEQHKQFGLSGGGLTDVIHMGKPLDVVVHRDVDPNLDVLCSGPIPPNPSELLGSDLMKEILEKLRACYDYIFIDLPPVLAVTDAAVMGHLADGVALVVRSGVVTPGEAKEARKQLQAVRANILGVILNGVPRDKKGYGCYFRDYGGNMK